MKKTFLILLVSALAVWGYVLAQVIRALSAKSEAGMQASVDFPPVALLALTRPPLDTAFRDPFQSYLYAQKPATPKPTATRRSVASPHEDAPLFKVNGIMLGDSPMAILEQNGKTEFARPGQEVFGFQVRSVEAGKVTLKKKGKVYILTYP